MDGSNEEAVLRFLFDVPTGGFQSQYPERTCGDRYTPQTPLHPRRLISSRNRGSLRTATVRGQFRRRTAESSGHHCQRIHYHWRRRRCRDAMLAELVLPPFRTCLCIEAVDVGIKARRRCHRLRLAPSLHLGAPRVRTANGRHQSLDQQQLPLGHPARSTPSRRGLLADRNHSSRDGTVS